MAWKSIFYLFPSSNGSSRFPSLPPSGPSALPSLIRRRPGLLHLLQRGLLNLDVKENGTLGGKEGGKEGGTATSLRPSASPVARLMYGYDVRGGLYFDEGEG